MDHAIHTATLVRRIVANPDDEAAWLAYAADLRDNGHDDLALIVRTFWPALAETLRGERSFDGIMAEVGRNLPTLHRAALRVASREFNSPDCGTVRARGTAIEIQGCQTGG
ncbi:MAG TPA: hypothetical protein VKD90_29250 [Gemmataceae bacterium]|nr:hypothetical protein [Gemmataceae bacterium]